MKISVLLFIVLLQTLIGARAQSSSSGGQPSYSGSPATNSPNAASSTPDPAFFIRDSKTIHTYRDVLAAIPSDFPHNAGKMTAIQRETVNGVLKRQFVDTQAPLDMYMKIEGIDNWGGWTLHADMPNQEGYKVRVFAHFTDDAKAQLAAFRNGDRVRVSGTVITVQYLSLWNAFTLSIAAKDCTVSK